MALGMTVSIFRSATSIPFQEWKAYLRSIGQTMDSCFSGCDPTSPQMTNPNNLWRLLAPVLRNTWDGVSPNSSGNNPKRHILHYILFFGRMPLRNFMTVPMLFIRMWSGFKNKTASELEAVCCGRCRTWTYDLSRVRRTLWTNWAKRPCFSIHRSNFMKFPLRTALSITYSLYLGRVYKLKKNRRKIKKLVSSERNPYALMCRYWIWMPIQSIPPHDGALNLHPQ